MRFLGTWPTPEPAACVVAALCLQPGDLWLKRNSLNGLGRGGNQIRKLEWTVGAAFAAGADTWIRRRATVEPRVVDSRCGCVA